MNKEDLSYISECKLSFHRKLKVENCKYVVEIVICISLWDYMHVNVSLLNEL